MRRIPMILSVSYLTLWLLTGTAGAQEIGPPPTDIEIDLDKPFTQVYAGNKVVITMRAKAPNGISKCWMRIVMRNGTSMLEGLELTATDTPNEVRGAFVVPAVQHGTDKQLPKGHYDIGLTRSP